MVNITDYSVELIKDPFGILAGERYEFMLDMEVAEEDELYSVNGLYVRVIYLVGEDREGILKHQIFEQNTDRLLDFELEDEEVVWLAGFCKERLLEAHE